MSRPYCAGNSIYPPAERRRALWVNARRRARSVSNFPPTPTPQKNTLLGIIASLPTIRNILCRFNEQSVKGSARRKDSYGSLSAGFLYPSTSLVQLALQLGQLCASGGGITISNNANMYNIKVQFEVLQITAWSVNGHIYEAEIMDVSNQPATVKRKQITLSNKELSMILQLNMWPRSAPELYNKLLEPLFKEWPQNLRPIP